MNKLVQSTLMQLFICALCTAGFFSSCSSPEPAASDKSTDSSSFYSADDFRTVEKTDAHVHVQTKDSSFLQEAKEDNFHLFTINYDDVNEPPPMEQQQEDALFQIKHFPEQIAYA